VAAALAAVHAAGVVHRDLKPGNVLLSLSGPRVIDFGIARALDVARQHTQVGMLVGTPGWMAPEQFRGGAVGPASDIFSWGSLVAYAATGRNPWQPTGSTPSLPPTAQAYKILHDQPDLTGLTGPLRRLVEAALAKDPARRPTARQLVDALLGADAPPADPTRAAAGLVERTWTGLPTRILGPAARTPGPDGSRGRGGGHPGAGGPAAGGSGAAAPRGPGGAAPRPAAAGPARPGGPPAGPYGTAAFGAGAGPGGRPAGAPGRPGARPAPQRPPGPPPWAPPQRGPVPPTQAFPPSTRVMPPTTSAGPAPAPAAGPANGGRAAPGQPKRARRSLLHRRTSPPPPPPPPETVSVDPPRPRRRRRFLRKRVLIPVGLLVGLSLLASPGDTPTAPASGSQLGTPVRDGNLEFVVRSVSCGVPTVGSGPFRRTAAGQYCLAQVQVTNVKNEARTLYEPVQRLIDSAGDKHRADLTMRVIYRDQTLWDKIEPGTRVAGTMVFDIPAGRTPVALELHDGVVSGGVKVRVR